MSEYFQIYEIRNTLLFGVPYLDYMLAYPNVFVNNNIRYY